MNPRRNPEDDLLDWLDRKVQMELLFAGSMWIGISLVCLVLLLLITFGWFLR